MRDVPEHKTTVLTLGKTQVNQIELVIVEMVTRRMLTFGGILLVVKQIAQKEH